MSNTHSNEMHFPAILEKNGIETIHPSTQNAQVTNSTRKSHQNIPQWVFLIFLSFQHPVG